jgi:PEP-CTERM motif
MKRVVSKMALILGAIVMLGLAGTSARADIVLIGPGSPIGGVGHAPESVLSIQSPKNTDKAFGMVAYNGSKDVITGEIAKKGEHTKTVTFADAGITSAGQLRIFMDIEDPDNDLVLHELTLTAYGSNGQILFQGSYLSGPTPFAENGGGQGHGDYTFGLTADQAAQLQAAYLADPNLRLGLFARTSDDTGSFTNFKIGNGPAAPIPEPATMFLLGSGLVGVAAKIRKRRNAAREE